MGGDRSNSRGMKSLSLERKCERERETEREEREREIKLMLRERDREERMDGTCVGKTVRKRVRRTEGRGKEMAQRKDVRSGRWFR